VILLFDFIDWMMRLPEAAEELFLDEMNTFEEERKMRYINSAERIGEKRGVEKGILMGIDKGLQQGVQQGLQQGLQQGIAQGIEQSIRSLLLNGFKPTEVARLLNADKKIVIRISKEVQKSDESPE